MCDICTHTAASDGQYTPTEIVELAKRRGLDLLAVMDHNTIAGVDEAKLSDGAAERGAGGAGLGAGLAVELRSS